MYRDRREKVSPLFGFLFFLLGSLLSGSLLGLLLALGGLSLLGGLLGRLLLLGCPALFRDRPRRFYSRTPLSTTTATAFWVKI
jgi:hypothetical protein